MTIHIDSGALQDVLKKVSSDNLSRVGKSAAKIAASQAGYVVLAKKARELAPVSDPSKDKYLNKYLPAPYGLPKRTRRYPEAKSGDLRRSIKVYKVKTGSATRVQYNVAGGIGRGKFIAGWYARMVESGHKRTTGAIPGYFFRALGDPFDKKDSGVVASKKRKPKTSSVVGKFFLKRAKESSMKQAVDYGLAEARKYVRKALA